MAGGLCVLIAVKMRLQVFQMGRGLPKDAAENRLLSLMLPMEDIYLETVTGR
jgi:hypothetical protein